MKRKEDNKHVIVDVAFKNEAYSISFKTEAEMKAYVLGMKHAFNRASIEVDGEPWDK